MNTSRWTGRCWRPGPIGGVFTPRRSLRSAAAGRADRSYCGTRMRAGPIRKRGSIRGAGGGSEAECFRARGEGGTAGGGGDIGGDGARAGTSRICDQSGEAETGGKDLRVDHMGGGAEEDEIPRTAASGLDVYLRGGGLEPGSPSEIDPRPELSPVEGPARTARGG